MSMNSRAEGKLMGMGRLWGRNLMNTCAAKLQDCLRNGKTLREYRLNPNLGRNSWPPGSDRDKSPKEQGYKRTEVAQD